MNSDSKDESIQGKWFRINKNVKKRVTASYDKIKDWKLDPKGYFLIDIDKKKKLLRARFVNLNYTYFRNTLFGWKHVENADLDYIFHVQLSEYKNI